MFKWRWELTLGEIFTNFDSWSMHMDKTYLGYYVLFLFPQGGTSYPSYTVLETDILHQLF